MRIAVIGKGNVGSALAPNFAAAGHDVVYGVRNPADPKYASDDAIPLRTVQDAVAGAEAILLAIHWDAVDGLLAEAGDLSGKILIDCTNAYDFHNNLAPLIPPDQSAATIIARKTNAVVVKAFNQVGAEVMGQAPKRSPRPLQFVASDDADAKAKVLKLAEGAGFDARDGGPLEYARELEGMARLWIAQVFRGMPGDTGWVLV
ncbi:NADPH-dependent F420 reductase [Sphingomonas sp.]|uniref:NADPH-dependent F420 reductase n=1 Tax=Sphingomonas sp. TaxID=28214 RepID=UPI0038ADF998